VVVTLDDLDDPEDLALGCTANGEKMQEACTTDLVFSVPRLIAEISAMLPLRPGDIIVTGAPAGIGAVRLPPRFLRPGDTLEHWAEGIGSIRNHLIPRCSAQT
jgi:2,4-didehydro-3-deoxy-L-rhamnonate hydrolase